MQMGSWAMGRVSGRANAIVPHPSDENTVYFGSAAGGVWKTTDGGASWTPLFDQVGTLPIGAIFVEPSAPDNVWVGTGDKNGGGCAGYFGQGVFLSQDGGATWSARNGSGTANMPLSVVNAVAVQPTDSNVVLVGGAGTCNSIGSMTNPGVFRSTDRGATWTRVLSVNVEDIVFVPGTSTVYLAAPGSGVYKSTDGGATWALSSNGMTVSGTSRMRLAMAPSDSQTLYALVENRLYRSIDGGANWLLRNNTACEGQCWYNQAIDVHPTNPNILLVGTIRAAYSSDGGSTFTALTTGWGGSQKVHQDTHVVLFSRRNGNRFWIGSDGGLWRTEDNGATFINMNSNLNVTQFYDIAVHPSNPDIVFGGAQDNSSSYRNASQVWDLTQVTGDGFMNGIDPANPSIVFQAGYPSSGFPYILRSFSGGSPGTFSLLPSSGLASSSNFPWVTPLAVASNYVFVGSDVVYRSVTSANPFSWTALTTGLVGTVTVIAPSQQGIMLPLYVGTASGRIYYSPDVAVASPNFYDVTGNFPGGIVSDVAITPGNVQRVFITRSGFSGTHLYRSTTGGSSWQAVGIGLPNVPANTVAIDPINTQRIFVGTDVGVYESTDGGDTFVAFSLGLPLGLVVMDLEVDDSPHYLHAGTFGRGAWKVALQGTTGGGDGGGGTDGGTGGGTDGGSETGTTFTYTVSNTNTATQNTANKVFALTAGQTITLGTCGLTGAAFTGDTYLRFHGPNGSEVYWNDDACGGLGSNFTYTVPAGGTGNYELRAGCYGNSSCGGIVAWNIISGNTGGGTDGGTGGGTDGGTGGGTDGGTGGGTDAGTASSGSFTFSVADTASATQNTANQNITAAAGQVITVGTCGLTGASASGDTVLRLQSPGGWEAQANDDACGGQSSMLTYTVPSGWGGTYQIRVGCYSSNSCSGTVAWTVQ
jgi:hypothetical protein